MIMSGVGKSEKGGVRRWRWRRREARPKRYGGKGARKKEARSPHPDRARRGRPGRHKSRTTPARTVPLPTSPACYLRVERSCAVDPELKRWSASAAPKPTHALPRPAPTSHYDSGDETRRDETRRMVVKVERTGQRGTRASAASDREPGADPPRPGGDRRARSSALQSLLSACHT